MPNLQTRIVKAFIASLFALRAAAGRMFLIDTATKRRKEEDAVSRRRNLIEGEEKLHC